MVPKKAAISKSKNKKKTINKFKNLIYASKIVNICLKNTPKPAPKPKKKKFLKLKSVSGIVNITIKSKITSKKFKSQKLKRISNNNFKIESKIKKKNIFNKTKIESFIINNIDKQVKNNNIFEVKNSVNIIIEGKKIDKSTSDKNNLNEIIKNESFYYENYKKNEDIIINKENEDKKIELKNINKDKIQNNNEYIIKKNYSFEYNLKSPKKEYQIIKNDICNFKGKNKEFSIMNYTPNISFSYDKIIKTNNTEINENNENKYEKEKIIFEIYKNESIFYDKSIINENNEINANNINKENIIFEIYQNDSFYYYDNNEINTINENENENKKIVIPFEISKSESFYYDKKIKVEPKIFELFKNESFYYEKINKKEIIFDINKNISFYYDKIIKKDNKKFNILRMIRNTSFALVKPKVAPHFSFKGFGNNLFGFKNILKSDSKDKKKEIPLKIKKSDSFIFKANPKKTQNKLVKQKNNSFYYEITKKKKLLFKTLISTSALSYQYNKTLLNNKPNNNNSLTLTPTQEKTSESKIEKKENVISDTISYSYIGIEKVENVENQGEKLQKMIDELNNIIKSKEEEIKRMEKEKSDVELANQLFTESSNEQIETLSNEIKAYKENQEKLINENKTLKDELEEKKGILDVKIKEYENDKTNLNKTIEELTKDNSHLKLDLFKKNTELENLKNSLNDKENTKEKENENNKSENIDKKSENKPENKSEDNNKEIEALKEEVSKLKQAKIIETSQLKLEMTKYKVEIKRLTNQIEKLKEEKNEANKINEDNMDTLKINDVMGDNNNDTNELKNKNKELQDQINKMKNEIEEYKKKVNSSGGGEVDLKKFEELKHQNLLYYNKLQEAQKKIAQANNIVGKAKKYNICIAYISQLIGLLKPENDKQTYLYVKLKSFVDEYEKEKASKKHE